MINTIPAKLFLTSATWLMLASLALAWGPHTQITAAALATLPDRARLEKYLGRDWQRLSRDYVWTPDWQEGVRPDHYAEDYLLFPAYPVHLSHMHPVVRRTYAPFFRRALQAIRTEDSTNAARWVGSLLHFVQDAGSPPHTTGIGGTLHGRMERWVDEKRISLPGYVPRILGKSDEEALKGFLARMDELYAFSKARSLKLRPLVEKIEKRVDQPLELECALECARVSADVMHTLFTLGLSETKEKVANLEGRLAYRPPHGYARVPAKVLLAGTSYSTTTDPVGCYRFRNLPPGSYTMWVLAPGYRTHQEKVELQPGRTLTLSPRLEADEVAGNLVRNPDVRLEWVKPGQPDGWRRDPARADRWASAVIRVPLERACLVQVVFQPGKSAGVALRWRSNPASTAGSREVALKVEKGSAMEVKPDRAMIPFEKGTLYLEVLIATPGRLAEVVRHVSVRFTGEGDVR